MCRHAHTVPKRITDLKRLMRSYTNEVQIEIYSIIAAFELYIVNEHSLQNLWEYKLD